MNTYWAYFKTRIEQETYYKFNFWMQLLSAWLIFYVEFRVWQAVFCSRTSLQHIGFTHLFSYIFYGHLLRTFFGTGIDEKIGDDYRTGQIVIDRLRPVGLFPKYLADDLGRGFIQMLTLTVPLVVTLFLTGTQKSLYVEDAAVFVGFTVLAYAMYFLINSLLGLVCFWTESILGIYMLKTACFGLLSGMFIPLDFYPKWLAALCHVLPFKMVYYAPLSRLLHPESPCGPDLYAFGFWLILLGGVYAVLQKAAFRRAVVQGG